MTDLSKFVKPDQCATEGCENRAVITVEVRKKSYRLCRQCYGLFDFNNLPDMTRPGDVGHDC